MSYEDMRRLIVLNHVAVLNRLVARRAALHAAMLSELDRRESRGEPVPGWVELELAARGRVDGAG